MTGDKLTAALKRARLSGNLQMARVAKEVIRSYAKDDFAEGTREHLCDMVDHYAKRASDLYATERTGHRRVST